MSIQRYKVSGTGAHKTSDGRWVKYDDHISLEKALKKVSDYNERLEARIDELQNIIHLLQQPELHNKIKAEGIREMRQHFKKRADEFNHYGVSLLEMAIYADKLEDKQ